MNTKQKYCGYITIVGKANVGKSTLINEIIGENISIVSRKKNTTQKNITGIKTEEHYQSIYIDTPGILFSKKKNYIQEGISNVYKIIKNSALIIFIINQVFWTEEDEEICEKIKKNNVPVIILINKIDKISNKNILLPYINFLKKKINAVDIIPISAKKRNNTILLEKIIRSYLPQCPHIYSKEYITTNSQFFSISEIIRKELILILGDELPSIIKVKIESLQKKEIGDWHIRAIIYVKNIRQKKIIIGHDGEKIKNISILSRYNIEKKFHTKTHLFLWVKV